MRYFELCSWLEEFEFSLSVSITPSYDENGYGGMSI